MYFAMSSLNGQLSPQSSASTFPASLQPKRTSSTSSTHRSRPPTRVPSRRQHKHKQQLEHPYTMFPVVNPLPTPPEDIAVIGQGIDRLERPYLSSGPSDLSSPSCAYPTMSLEEKVREANHALIHTWGSYLVGSAISELCDTACTLVNNTRLISVIDLPNNFCIAPSDELLCPSDDPTRVIVVVNDTGLIIDTGVFDNDGPVFYKGHIVSNRYVPAVPPRTA